MREILFRGKQTDNGRWVEGRLLSDNTIVPKGQPFYVFNNHIRFIEDIECFNVKPNTIGQYTDLTDKNGTKIFEGDIVKCTDTFGGYEFIAVVMFGNPNGEYNWGFQLNRISGASANTDILLWVEMEETGAFIEIIGNMHDNPELLESEVEGE